MDDLKVSLVFEVSPTEGGTNSFFRSAFMHYALVRSDPGIAHGSLRNQMKDFNVKRLRESGGDYY